MKEIHMSTNDDTNATLLTPEQIAFFKDNGCLLLSDVLDPDLCAKARDRLWAALPPDVALRRDDPQTHVGPFSEADTNTDHRHWRKGFRWNLRDISTDPEMQALIYSTSLCTVAEQLLGQGTVQRPIIEGIPMGSRDFAWPDDPVDPTIDAPGVRGIYCTLPFGDLPKEPDKPHNDAHPFHFGVVGLIHDVPPNGGGFKVWPKSHRRLYPTFWMQYDMARVPSYDHLPRLRGIANSAAYHAELERIGDDTEPVDCWGAAGDVVLWHHRLAHMAGHNHSSVIRQAVLGDFAKTDLDTTRMDPPQADMWRDWSEGLKASAGSYSDDLARAQRLIP